MEARLVVSGHPYRTLATAHGVVLDVEADPFPTRRRLLPRAVNGASISASMADARPVKETCSQCRKARPFRRPATEVAADALAFGEFRCTNHSCGARIPYSEASLDALREAVERDDLDAIEVAVRSLAPASP